MYERFYDLRERPFDLAPDPAYLLLTPQHHEAFLHLRCALTPGRGVMLLLAEAGTGKTTLIRAALLEQRREADVIVAIDNPTLTRAEFLEALADGFHLSAEAATSKRRLLAELTDAIEACSRAGGRSALVVDEAQALSEELIEEIRLLSNVRSPSVPHLPIILVGLPELGLRLREPSLDQLKQRIGLRCVLMPLSLVDTGSYIAGRVRIAGGDGASIFTADAVRLIHERSRGIPRTVSVICDNALMAGFAAHRRPIDADIIATVCGELDIEGAEDGGAAARPTGRPPLSPVAEEPLKDAPIGEPAMAGATAGAPAAVASPSFRRLLLSRWR